MREDEQKNRVDITIINLDDTDEQIVIDNFKTEDEGTYLSFFISNSPPYCVLVKHNVPCI